MRIIQPATRSVVELNRWLAQKECPPYAGLYATAGMRYGVAWDIAIFQSCLETNFFKFGGDVKPAQNNFAGIGAFGGGAPGDSFPNPQNGIEAQMQNLALRAGVKIPIETIISAYTKRHYSTIAGRNTPLWEQLAGTYATDIAYWTKIKRIMQEFDNWSVAENPNVTWFNFYREPSGGLRCAAFAGNSPVAILNTRDKNVLIDFLNRYPKAVNCEIAPSGAVPPDVTETTPTTPETPPAGQGKLKGKRILIDPGHSSTSAGAEGRAPDKPQEYALNVLQSRIIAEHLRREGAAVEIYDPIIDDLRDIGARAKNAHLSLHLHHNAANADGIDEGTETYAHRSANAETLRLAKAVNDAIVDAIKSNNRGVKLKSYTVLDAAKNAGCPISILTESYFIDDYGSRKIAENKSTLAAIAIAEAVVKFYS